MLITTQLADVARQLVDDYFVQKAVTFDCSLIQLVHPRAGYSHRSLALSGSASGLRLFDLGLRGDDFKIYRMRGTQQTQR